MDDERWNDFAASFAPSESLHSHQLSQEDNNVTLNTLPSDIIRKIILMGQEDIHNTRQISLRWNDITRKCLPVMECFCWMLLSPYSKMIIDVPSKYRKYFALEDWMISEGDRNDNSPVEHSQLFHISWENEQHSVDISSLFGLCSVVNKVVVQNVDRAQQYFPMIRQGLEATNVVEINIVNIWGTVELITSQVLSIIPRNRIQILSLDFNSSVHLAINSSECFISFFTNAFALVSEINIIWRGTSLKSFDFWQSITQTMNGKGYIAAMNPANFTAAIVSFYRINIKTNAQ